MKFSQVILGTRAEKAIAFEAGGKTRTALVRPLSLAEEIDADAEAIKLSKRKGAEAVAGNTVFESYRMMAVVACAILDEDSPPAARERYFDGGIEQVATLTPDVIAHLHQLQQAWQEECSPSFTHKTTADLFVLVRKLVEDEHDPLVFARVSVKTQWTLLPFMARLLRPLLEANTFSGSSSETPPTRPESDRPPESSPSESVAPSPATTTAPTPSSNPPADP